MKKLVVLLTIVVSVLLLINASAAYELEVKAFGSKGVEGFVESYADNIILNITISYISSFNLSKIKIDDISANLLNAKCIEKDPTTQTYECSVDLGWLMSEDCETHYVYYGEDSAFKKSVKICIDNKPPVVNDFYVRYKHLTSSQDLVFKLDAKDQAKSEIGCAGLKSAKLVFNTGSSYEFPLYEGSNYCTYLKNDVVVPLSSFYESDFTSVNQVCIIVIDFFGKESEPVCENINIDDNPPEFDEGSFSLLTVDRESAIGHYVQQNKEYSVVPFVQLSDESDAIVVKGNFSLFENGEEIYDFKDVTSSCEKRLENFECYFAPISFRLVNPSSSYVLRYRMRAQDLSGNSAYSEGIFELFIDKTRPRVNEIKAITSIDEKNYLTSGSTIAVSFYEEGCGFNRKRAYISSAAFGRKEADECYKEGSEWVCLFKDINPSISYNEQEVNVAVTPDTKDDCDNVVESTTGRNFFIDLSEPRLVSEINVTNQDNELFIKEGDSIKIRFNAEDFSENLYIEANFSKVNGDEYLYRDECEKLDSRNFTCEAYVSSAMECSEDVILRIYDNANNSLMQKVSINVYRRNENPSNDFWSIGYVKISPEKIDRTLSEKLSLYAFADVEFKARSSNQHMVSFSIENCESEINAEVIPLYQNDDASGDKIITFVIKIPHGTSIEKYSEDVTCTFAIKTHKGQTVTINPEYENVKFTLKFYDGSVGESRDAVFHKVRQKYNIVKNIDSWFGKTLLPTYEILKTGCDLYSTYNDITRALDAAGTVAASVPGGQLVYKTAVENDVTHAQLTSTMGVFCDWTLCSSKKEELCNKIKESSAYIEGVTSCPDPAENIIVGLATGCYIPPIINSFSKMYYIETATLDCYLTAIETGTPIYVCDSLAGQYYCENIAGGFLNGLLSFAPAAYAGWSDVLNLAGLSAESLEDPVSAAISLGLQLLPQPPTHIIGVAKIISSISNAINTYEKVNEMINQFENFGESYATEVLAKYEEMFGSEEEIFEDESGELPPEEEPIY